MPASSPSPLLQVAEEADGVVVRFAPGTSITELNADAFGRELSAVAARHSQTRVTLDLANVELMTSSALAKLLALNTQLRGSGGHLTLANPKPVVRLTIAVAKLDTVLDLRPKT